jgi:penicillin-binding protein 2
VRNGDVLAMASWPTYNPSYFAEPPPVDAWKELMAQWTNDDLQLQDDHALQGEYAPGSVFKIVVGLAALERGLDPAQILTSPGYVPIPGRPKGMGDTAKEGDYDFNRAMAKSCNYYFVTITTNDPKAGVLPKIIELGQRLHFGERTGLIPHEEDGGYFPTTGEITEHNWHIGNTANICIGQDKVAVTPLQIAVMVSAVANGGRVYYPRLVSKITPYGSDEPSRVFPAGRLRDTLDVSPRSLGIVHDAMRFEVTSPEGTGKEANVDGMRVAGKTGTAQYEKNGHVDKSLQITWFASFAPVDEPRYAVVAMAVGGSSGGGTCAPLAGEVYKTILKKERQALTATTAMAEMAK